MCLSLLLWLLLILSQKEKEKSLTYRAERVSAFHIVISDTRGVFEESTMFIFAESPLGLWEVRLAFEKSVGCSRFSSSFHVCVSHKGRFSCREVRSNIYTARKPPNRQKARFINQQNYGMPKLPK